MPVFLSKYGRNVSVKLNVLQINGWYGVNRLIVNAIWGCKTKTAKLTVNECKIPLSLFAIFLIYCSLIPTSSFFLLVLVDRKRGGRMASEGANLCEVANLQLVTGEFCVFQSVSKIARKASICKNAPFVLAAQSGDCQALFSPLQRSVGSAAR